MTGGRIKLSPYQYWQMTAEAGVGSSMLTWYGDEHCVDCMLVGDTMYESYVTAGWYKHIKQRGEANERPSR